MTRNLKALGLALMAAFALSAALAAGAQAETHKPLHLTAGEYPASLTGEQIEGAEHKVHIFEPEVGQITCAVAKFSGTIKTAEENTQVTITPTYENCDMKIGLSTFPATVFMTECDYLFTEGTEVKANEFNKGQSSLVCPGSNTPHIKVYKSAEHTDANRRCEFTVTPFVHLGENIYTNTAGSPNDVDITSKVSGIKVHRTFGLLAQCGLAEQTATYTGTTTLRAYKDPATHNAENQLSLTVSK